MPLQSSLAAGIIQTAMRLSVSLGLAITSAVYGSVLSHTQNPNFPFERAYLCSIVFAAVGLLIVPFMRLGTQGDKTPPPSITEEEINEEERSRTGGEYSDCISIVEIERTEPELTLSYKGSETSLWSGATYGSEESFFPRWSWEDERNGKFSRHGSVYGNEKVVYEVCTKCLEERRVVLASPNRNHNHNLYDMRMVQMRCAAPNHDPNPYETAMPAEINGAVGDGGLEGWL
jgi:hypothetical protein